MGPLDNFSDQSNPQPGASPAETALLGLSQDLEALRHKVSTQLAEDIAYLQGRKQRLMSDIETLEADFDTLQAQHQQLQLTHAEALSQQQQAQQQVWAKRLALALANHLQARLESSLPGSLNSSNSPDALASFDLASQRVASLDATIHGTLQALQQDLNSYHSSLSQQISRMHGMEQQGEAILEALVTRLSHQLQTQMLRSPVAAVGAANGHGPVQLPTYVPPVNGNPNPLGQAATPYPSGSAYPDPSLRAETSLPTPRPTGGVPSPSAQSQAAAPAQKPRQFRSNAQMGLLFVVLSTLALSLHNVLVGVIGNGGQLFGQFPMPDIFPLTIPNSLMLLWLRMVVVLPLLSLVATKLYPRVWQDLRDLFNSDDKRPVFQVIASGSFLFLSQVLIYKAISDVGPGVAVTLLFMYPLITVPLAWFLFGDRPTSLRLVVMFAISMGIVFTALPKIYTDVSGDGVSLWGVGAALLSSVAFALFLVAMQLSFRRLHPVPVSLLQFSTIFALTSLILIVGSFFGLQTSQPTSQLGLYVSAGLLGLLTLLGYLCNNYGVKLMGAAQASIVAASGPVMTAIMAYVITPGEKSNLQFIQWMGVVLVTLGVISLSLERLTNQRRRPRRSGAPRPEPASPEPASIEVP